MKYETLISGKYNTAKVFTDKIDVVTNEQIQLLMDQEFIKDSRVRIMPDCHKGNSVCIGFTMDIKDKIVPNLVGVDIGCAILAINLEKNDIDLLNLDNQIKEKIPSGRNINDSAVVRMPEICNLKCYRELRDTRNFERSLSTLGGGNHFCSIEVEDNGNKWLLLHSGSRNLGHQVATYYQKLAIDLCKGKDKFFVERDELISSYKATGRKSEISSALKELENKYASLTTNIPEELCYLSGSFLEDYLHDVEICQRYASLNRRTMGKKILQIIDPSIDKLEDFEYFETVHNYIDQTGNVPILRKGAVSANLGEKLIIPMNMRDGSLICIGKGNKDWNYSAPHCAGRLMSRTVANNTLDLNQYISTMANVYTTSVCKSTLDEAPDAYKPMDEIIERINDTIDIISRITPIYNFKATNEE